MHYKRWRLLKAGDVVHLEEWGKHKNPNHSFYGKVVLTSHEKSEESEAVNQFMIIEVCGDPLESKTFDVYSDTVFRLEQDLRKQNLKPLRTKWIETIEYVGNQVKTEDLDFSPFGKAFHDEVHEYCQGLKMEQEERLEQPERDAKWKNHSDAVNLFLSKHHMVQNQRWSLKFAREFLYKELIEFERYQRREKRAVVNEDPFSQIFHTSIEKFSVYSEEPPVGCASLVIMQVPVRLLKVINAEDATKRNFVDFAPRFPNLKRKLDSTIPSGDALSAPASKRARIEESSINDSSKIPSIQSLVELEAVTSSPSIRSLSDNSEASLPVAMDEDNDDEGMEIRKYPGSLTSKAIGTDHRGTKFLAPIVSSTEHEAAKDWDPKKSKAFMAKVLRASREAMGPSNKDNSTKSTVPITVDSISDGSNYALRELCNVAKTALLIVKGKPFSESTTISRVEDATMEAPVQEEVVLQNDGRDRVESGASSTAPTRIENQGRKEASFQTKKNRKRSVVRYVSNLHACDIACASKFIESSWYPRKIISSRTKSICLEDMSINWYNACNNAQVDVPHLKIVERNKKHVLYL
ncbi:hypothetical protein B9Z55_026113 [Caenorhabditis nigoni]|uniref:Uncharacterized protein n=1 Tax=Caenorhabditis nigoni TaxID=1611254 RepID=A0A2G5T1N0_9PELO|nr:hypothetical protein B9Z55_026113 [Caenorhabditis nigoni]